MRLIDSDVLDRMGYVLTRTYQQDKETMVYETKKLSGVPSVQPQRKTGKWINVNEGKWNTFEVLKCSVCGEMDNRMSRADKYCPNCGARMDGE